MSLIRFDPRGGLLVYRHDELYQRGPPDREVFARAVSSTGSLAAPISVGWRARELKHMERLGDHFAVVFRAGRPEDATQSDLSIGVLDVEGRAVGPPVRLGPGGLGTVSAPLGALSAPMVHDDALYWIGTSGTGTKTLDRLSMHADGTIQRSLVAELRPVPSPTHREGVPFSPVALAVSGDRWAVIVTEVEPVGRTWLYSSAREAPVRLFLPVPRQRPSFAELRFVGDRLQLAGRAGMRNNPHARLETPAWILDLPLDGRTPRAPMRLAPEDTFVGNRVRGTILHNQPFARVDALERPIGDALELPAGGNGIVSGHWTAFFAIVNRHARDHLALRIECEPGTPPTVAPRVPFEGDPDPGSPCGGVACAISAPTLRALTRAVGAECGRLAFEGRAPHEDRDASADAVHVVRSRTTGDPTITEVATLLCARGISYDSKGRWAFLAARTASGWSACTLAGMHASYFDFGLEIGEVRTEPWLEGDPPELVVSVTIDENASDAGEISESRTEDLHICGWEGGHLVCWGSIPASWRSREGSADERVRARHQRNRIEPDGHGLVTITPSGDTADPPLRRDVRRLRPGCPELPTDPEAGPHGN